MYIVFMIIFGITSMIFAIIGYAHFGSHDATMQDFKENWLMKPIVEITTSEGAWPDGYENLIDRQWPGTRAGWDCTTSERVQHGVRAGYCTSDETSDGCKSIEPASEIPYEKFYSHSIWARRSGDNFVDAIRPDTNSEFKANKGCPENYRLCGSGKIEYSLCVKNEEDWPINLIYITNDTSSLNDGYERQPLDDGYEVVYSTTNDTLPAVRLKLTQGKVWANAGQQERTKGREKYKLLLNDHVYGCKSQIDGTHYDPRWTLIGQITEERLFEDNDIDTVVQNLPEYPVEESKDYTWNLYISDYYYWDPKCDRKATMETLHKSDELNSMKYKLMLLCIIHVSVGCLFLHLVMLHYTTKEADDSDDGLIPVESRQNFEMIAYSIIILLLFLISLYFLRWIYETKQYYNEIISISTQNCANDFTSALFQEYSTSLIHSFFWLLIGKFSA